MANKRLFGPALLTNSAATKYTVPADTLATVRRIRANNPSGGAVTFTLSIGADAQGTRLWDAFSIPAGQSVNDYGPFTLAEGEIIQAFAGTTNVIVLIIDGQEVAAP